MQNRLTLCQSSTWVQQAERRNCWSTQRTVTATFTSMLGRWKKQVSPRTIQPGWTWNAKNPQDLLLFMCLLSLLPRLQFLVRMYLFWAKPLLSQPRQKLGFTLLVIARIAGSRCVEWQSISPHSAWGESKLTWRHPDCLRTVNMNIDL